MPPAIALLAALVTSTSAPATDGKSGLVCDADGSASVRLRPESTAYWTTVTHRRVRSGWASQQLLLEQRLFADGQSGP
jgi:hypothetical protein